MSQEFLKHAIPDYLVRELTSFSLNFQTNKPTKVATANTTVALQCECPVLNHKYIGHIIELHLIGHVAQ